MAVIFDFDLSFVDDNTDEWLPKVVAPDLLDYIKEKWRAGVPWNRLMGQTTHIMHQRGVTRAQIEDALCKIPIQDGMIEAVKHAKGNGLKVAIVSDANEIYIKTILEHHKIEELIDLIITNPAHFETVGKPLPVAVGTARCDCRCEPGKDCDCGDMETKVSATASSEVLMIGPRYAVDTPHGCPRCPPNMCKGLEVDSILHTLARDCDGSVKRPRVIYIGDGGGDVCAALSLGASDVVLARKGYAMYKSLTGKYVEACKATLHPWETGRDVLAEIQSFVVTCGTDGAVIPFHAE